MRKTFSLIAGTFLFCCTFFFSLLLFAQLIAPPETVDGATSLIPQFIASLAAGNYNVAGGILLMVLMVAIRQFVIPKSNLSTDILPFVSAIVASLALAGLSMMNGVTAVEALKNGLIMSLLAGGTWSLVGKYIAKLVLGDKYVESK